MPHTYGLSVRAAGTMLAPEMDPRGERLANAIIYFHDGDRVTIAATNAGDSRHPAWYHNLRAHPFVTFGRIPMQATVLDDDTERDRLWVLADRVFPTCPWHQSPWSVER